MIAIKKRETGVTLVEILLVIVIGAGILFLSLKQYESFRSDTDALQLQTNVDTILQAMSQYYYANCYGSFDPSKKPPLTPGTLNPTNTPAPKNPFPVDIQTLLINGGYLLSPLPINPIVDSGPTPTQTTGYVAQFNESTQNRLTCLGGTNATGVTPATGCTGATAVIGIIVIWKPQVAILVKDVAKIKGYQGLLNADCTSSLNGNTVYPCSSNKPGNYLVWERMPSLPATKGNSDLWEMKNSQNNFNQLYNTYSKVYLSTEKGMMTPSNKSQYFLCGG